MDMARETENVAEDFKGKVKEGKEQVKRYASQAKQVAGEYAQQAKQVAGEYADKAKEYATQARDVTEEQIKQNPFVSMLIALGVGVTLGMALSAAFSSRKD